MLRIITTLILCFLLSSIVSGCARYDELSISRMFQSFQSTRSAEQLASVRSRADQLLMEDRPASALTLLHRELDNGTAYSDLSEHYDRAINASIDQADDLYQLQKYSEAGNLLRNVLDCYPENGVGIAMKKNVLSILINKCADRLLESGLVAYRAGQLEGAIEVWSQIREFHPAYRASQDAIKTTRIQLKKIEALRDGPG